MSAIGSVAIIAYEMEPNGRNGVDSGLSAWSDG